MPPLSRPHPRRLARYQLIPVARRNHIHIVLHDEYGIRDRWRLGPRSAISLCHMGPRCGEAHVRQ